MTRLIFKECTYIMYIRPGCIDFLMQITFTIPIPNVPIVIDLLFFSFMLFLDSFYSPIYIFIKL